MTCCVTQCAEFTWRSLLSECHNVSRYTDKWNFIYARKKSTTSSAPIFMKLAKAPQQYVKIFYRESHTNRTINV
jgi:hypothetical protein